MEEFKDLLENPELAARIEQLVELKKQPLVSKRDELLGELKTARQQLEAAQAELEAARARTEQKVEEVHPNQLDQLRTMLQQREQELAQIKTAAEQAKIESQLSSVIKEARGVYELLEPHLRGRVKLVDGQIQVFDTSGNPMYKNGEPAQLRDLVEEMRTNPIYGRAFDATASGTGNRNSTTKVNSVITDPADPNYSLSAHMEFLKKNPNARTRT